MDKQVKDITDIFTEEELKIYSMLISENGEMFLRWLRKRTVDQQMGLGVADGIQTAILTARELGRSDIYHEINKLINRVSKYARELQQQP
jgi:hypothetical protein